MQILHDRRRFLATLSAAGAAGLVGAGNSLTQEAPAQALPTQEPPPETATIRLPKGPLCSAPQYIADELLRAEGFTDIQHVRTLPSQGLLRGVFAAISRGELDFSQAYSPSTVVAIDAGLPVTVLAGVHAGCNAVFAHEGIRGIRDLKGKKVGSSFGPSNALFASMFAYVGLDPAKDIEWVSSPAAKELFIERKIDAFLAGPPDPPELRARNIGHVIVDSGLDRPWSQQFCCVFTGNREFVRKHPVATKRALRAILKAADFCASDPAGAARRLADVGFTQNYDYTRQSLAETLYNKWREYDPEDSIRFYSLRLREAGYIKSIPGKIIADGTDWRFLNQLKRELKG